MAFTILLAAAFAASLAAEPAPAAAPARQADFIQAQAAAETQSQARWSQRICFGVTGLSAENAQFVIDRMSQRASEFGLRARRPGCTPNVLIVFTADPRGQAASVLAERSDPASAVGRSGNTRGREALNADFVNSDDAVRWWSVTRTTTEIGENASRNERFAEPPRVNVPERGRLGATTFESISHVIVIADLRQVNGLRLGALADYFAMVSLAQIAPDAAEGRHSILNLFSDRSAGRAPAEGLTTWDIAYLRGVYGRAGV